jgi:hypothetical protein
MSVNKFNFQASINVTSGHHPHYTSTRAYLRHCCPLYYMCTQDTIYCSNLLFNICERTKKQEVPRKTDRLLSFDTARTTQKTKQVDREYMDTQRARWSHKPPSISSKQGKSAKIQGARIINEQIPRFFHSVGLILHSFWLGLLRPVHSRRAHQVCYKRFLMWLQTQRILLCYF